MSFQPIPTAEQASGIARQVAEEEARVAALELELAALRISIAAKKFAIAPIRRLPWEMLAACFYAATHRDPFFIITLSHVCRSFRHAAHVSPSLWSKLSINITNPRVTELVDLFLKHSGFAPLDIAIPRPCLSAPVCHKHLDDYTVEIETLMRQLRPHQPRLRSLDLHVRGIETATAALNICVGPAPTLQCLQVILDCDQDREREELVALKHAFQPCPSLRVLKLQHCELPVRILSTTGGSFSSVKSLNLGHSFAPLSLLQRSLALFPDLLSLACVHWHVPIEDDFDIPDIVLPSLTKLVITDETTGKSGLSLLSSLTAPSLRILKLENLFDQEFVPEYQEDEDEDMDYQDNIAQVGEGVRDFLQRSGYPRLKSLELSHSEMPPDDLVYILRRMDHVEDLGLSGTKLTAGIFKNLAARQKKRLCVPRMHSFSLSDVTIKPKMITKLIEARNVATDANYRPLQRITLSNCSGISESDRVNWQCMDPIRLTVKRVVSDVPCRPVDFVSSMLDAMMFGPLGPPPLYF